jgi:hypothetical protein
MSYWQRYKPAIQLIGIICVIAVFLAVTFWLTTGDTIAQY